MPEKQAGVKDKDRAEIRRNPPLIMSAGEVAVYLGISERKLRQDSMEGVIPSVRLGGRILFRLEDVNQRLTELVRGKGNF